MNLQQLNKSCPICFSEMTNPYTIGCTHLFCYTCIKTWIHSTTSPSCPVCRREYVGLFKIPTRLLTSKYKTRHITEEWRGFKIFVKTQDMLDEFNNLNTADERCNQLNKILNYIYKNKWIFNRKRNISTWFDVNGLRDIFKDRLEEFSKNECFKEGKMWKYKFRDVLK